MIRVMTWCHTCGEDDHYTAGCELRLGAPRNAAALLPQHATCWKCRQLIYAWDHMPCGAHVAVGVQRERAEAPPVTPPRQPARDLRALARQQVAEARAARAVLDSGQPQRDDDPRGDQHGHSAGSHQQ